MLDRKAILERLKTFPYDKSKFWISTGGAMVLHGVRPYTHDIDVGCEKEIAEALVASGCQVIPLPDGGKKIVFDGVIEVFENWSRGDTIIIDTYRVLTLDSIIDIKRRLGREKDFRDIELIENFKKTKNA